MPLSEMNCFKSILFLLVSLIFASLKAQKDSVTVLDEVILTDVRLLHFSNGNKVEVLTDSVLVRNGNSLTDLLQFNTGIYFKENGLGMLSSPSFRGTNASQTAVVWNGININSQLTGQIDFNTIVPRNYGSVSVRSGGGSVQFGSGAVGGSVHLNDVFRFKAKLDQELGVRYGSFETKNINYSISAGSEKIAFGLGLNYAASENDYKYLGTDKRNENGAFENVNLNTHFGYRLSDKQLLKFYHNTFLGNRDFSGTLTAPSNSNYQDINSRNLLEWNHFNEGNIHRIKMAYLYEKYKYFDNKERDDFSFGNTNTLIANYDFKKQFKNSILNTIVDYSNTAAMGSSIEDATRNALATTLLFTQNVGNSFTYGAHLRKEFVKDYKSPFIYALNANYNFSNYHKVYFNASKNYRIPTFNEIYWLGAGSSGNANIQPESSWQAEFGQAYGQEKYTLEWTIYYISSDDLIQWRPDTQGVWSPVNISDASNYGLEISFDLTEKWGKHRLDWNNGYFYTKAIDNETNEILIYVPEHKITSNLIYGYGNWSFFFQLFYNGDVFITTDNSESLPAYTVSNLGLGRNFKIKNKLSIDALVQINNLFNKNYQNVAFRPMPNRNINFQITLKL